MQPIVLLVDDDQNLLHGLVRALRRQPFQLFTARSGEEAMAVIKARPIDVLVTDYKMPGMSGNELLAWVTRNAPEIMRIVLTGHATTEAVIRAVNEGDVFQYFTKPCREVDLAMAIHNAVEYRNLSRENQWLTEEGRRWHEQRREVSQRIDRIRRLLTGPLGRRLSLLSDRCQTSEPDGAPGPDAEMCELLEEAVELLDETQRIAAELRANPSFQPAGVPVPAPVETP
ncbi:MAG: response regulator [Thermoguttaceae bacterium]|jgi:response regulator RpfG family c-di-GMP phosphodiesterase|nr:response regulator [Thermoguttaceae bacterium]